LNADVIFAIDKGKVVEFGTHDELMNNKRLYYKLVINQQKSMGNIDQFKKNYCKLIMNNKEIRNKLIKFLT
jgi:hypothetical protein